MSGQAEGWGGGLRHLHWIVEDEALCNPKLRILGLVEDGAKGAYVDDYACKRCQAKLARLHPLPTAAAEDT